MTSLREAAQQALSIIDGMEQNYGNLWQVNASPEELDALCTSLREALAEPQDPVAYNGWVLREVLFDNGEPVGHREPQQEPVLVVEKEPDYWSGGHFYKGDKPHINPTKVWGLSIGTKLYTAPQPAKQPLTDREVGAIMEELNAYGTRLWEFARAIERAHGITGETK